MDLDELIEARDTLDNLASCASEAMRNLFDKTVTVLNDIIGCEDCLNRGWTVLQSNKNDAVLVLMCNRCNRFQDAEDAGKDAVEVINSLLKRDGHKFGKLSE